MVFAQHLGGPFVTALPSRKSTLPLSLAPLGIGPGNGVIVYEATFDKGVVQMDRVCRGVGTLLVSGPTLT